MINSDKVLGELMKCVTKECRHYEISQQCGSIFIVTRIVGLPEAVMTKICVAHKKVRWQLLLVATVKRKD